MHISQTHAKVTTLKSAVVSATTSQQQQGTTRASTAAHVASHAGPFEQAAIGGRYEGLRGGKVPPTPPNCVRSPVGAPAKAPEEAHHQIPTVSGLKTRRGCGQPTRGRRAPPRAGRFLPPAPGRGSPAAQAPQGSQARRVFFSSSSFASGGTCSRRSAARSRAPRARSCREAAAGCSGGSVRGARGRIGRARGVLVAGGGRGRCTRLLHFHCTRLEARRTCARRRARARLGRLGVHKGAWPPPNAVAVGELRSEARACAPRGHLRRASSAVVVRALPESCAGAQQPPAARGGDHARTAPTHWPQTSPRFPRGGGRACREPSAVAPAR